MAKCACCEQKLTPTEQKNIDKFRKTIREYKSQNGCLIPLLQEAQNTFGYLPGPLLKMMSVELGKPYSEVAGVTGFYSFFSTVPRGKYLVRVCLGTACYVRGGSKVLEAIKKHLKIDVGQTTPDRMFSLDIGRCFGACGLAPVIMVNDDVHQRVKPATVQKIIEQYRGKKSTKKSGKERR